ncbi:FAD:protein FMN transferase [Clostridium sp. Ade.TY]|uniref:FAD:protein FMN transferase n=1 Tax=Clostridium sp. Ade.TY TaxID=1391647 RepID=UPI00041BEA3B|nr:FAD:protein FMN transferase [Clostridium sp. Ade.TY]
MGNKTKFITFLMIIVFSIGLYGCKDKKKIEPISRTELFMGTSIKVTLYDYKNEKVLDKVFDRVIELENLVSINKPNTEIDNLNKNSGVRPVNLSEDSFNIVKKGLEYSKLSEGDYDITIGPLVKLWSIGLPEAKVPNKSEIKESINNINYSNVYIDENTKEVFLKKKGMMLDLGSIAKGYTADEIAKILKDEGVNSAIIDLGGNIYALGYKEVDKKWKIGVQDPFTDRGNIIGTVAVANKSVVTSGIYERYIEDNGKKYHHILNPKTGYPYETNIAGVSIISDKSIDGDALSTLVFTKGLEKGLEFINKLDGVDAIFIMNNKNVYITDGIREDFKIINDNYKLVN